MLEERYQASIPLTREMFISRSTLRVGGASLTPSPYIVLGVSDPPEKAPPSTQADRARAAPPIIRTDNRRQGTRFWDMVAPVIAPSFRRCRFVPDCCFCLDPLRGIFAFIARVAFAEKHLGRTAHLFAYRTSKSGSDRLAKHGPEEWQSGRLHRS